MGVISAPPLSKPLLEERCRKTHCGDLYQVTSLVHNFGFLVAFGTGNNFVKYITNKHVLW